LDVCLEKPEKINCSHNRGEKAGEILGFMQLEPDKKVSHLSKGNRGRLKILLVLSRRAPLILMDEPLAGLDPLVRDSIKSRMTMGIVLR
jgi:ABC-type multidrug transport system ATPase subunit